MSTPATATDLTIAVNKSTHLQQEIDCLQQQAMLKIRKQSELQQAVDHLQHVALLGTRKQAQLQQKLEAKESELQDAHRDVAVAQAIAGKRYDVLMNLTKADYVAASSINAAHALASDKAND